MATKTYETPEAFRSALESRIRARAETLGRDLNRERQLLLFDRLTARMTFEFGDHVVMKGGMVLELRLDIARTTKDVDFNMIGDPKTLLDRLQRAAQHDLNDWLRFDVVRAKSAEIVNAVYDGQRFKVQARLGSKTYGDPFGVDIGFGSKLIEAPELLPGSDLLAFIGLSTPQHRVYPRSAHLAEKLHAYTLPVAEGQHPNSRVKDLPDMALLGGAPGAYDPAVLRAAIVATFEQRRTHAVPSRVPDPPAAWRTPYAALAAENDLPWRDLATVSAAVRAFVDPVLAGTQQSWDATLWAWR